MNVIGSGITSWKTTICGAVVAIAIALKDLEHLDWKTGLAAAAVALFGFFSKDSNVTSEQAGLTK